MLKWKSGHDGGKIRRRKKKKDNQNIKKAERENFCVRKEGKLLGSESIKSCSSKNEKTILKHKIKP